MLGDFDCTLDKINRDGGNKTQRIYRTRAKHALPKLIVDNERTQIPLSSPTMIDPLRQNSRYTEFILI